MIKAKIHSAAVLAIGEALAFIAALLIGFLAKALSWNVPMAALAAALVWFALLKHGKADWASIKRVSAYDELKWRDSLKFLLRHVLLYFFAAAGFLLGYCLVAILFKAATLTSAGVHALERLAPDPNGFLAHFPPDCPGRLGLMRYGAGITLAFFGVKLARLPKEEWSFLRGRKLLTRREAQLVATRRRSNDQATFRLGGVGIPDEATRTHICVVGATGSGKTKTINGILKDAVSTICDERDERAILFDGKQELIPLLHALGIRCRYYILNPFDIRCVAWDVARDCTSVTTVDQIAVILVAADPGPNRFFADAARHIVASLMLSFMRFSPRRWTLRHVILVARNTQLLRQALMRHAETADVCQYFDEERTYQNIRSCLNSKINQFAPIAACWDRASEKIALVDWISSTSILLLGWVPSIDLAMGAVNRAIYQRASELLLSQRQSDTRKVWHIFDEVKELGKMEALCRMATFGRGAGNRIVIGLQDLQGLRHAYGRELASELVGQCAIKVVLRSDDPDTASWAAKIIGDAEVLERRSGGGNESVRQREAVLTSEILNLPPTTVRNGLSGFYVSPFTGAFRSTLSAEEVNELSPLVSTKWQGFIPRPSEHQFLRPLDQSDFELLGLKPTNP